MTPLDHVISQMQMRPDDTKVRMQVFDRFMTAQLFLMLDTDPTGDQVTPTIFEPTGGAVALGFDTEERLSDFAQTEQAYVALSGRQIAALLGTRRVGLGLNLGAASEMLISHQELAWLAQTASRPEHSEFRAQAIRPPGPLPEALISSLDARLAGMTGLAQVAYLAGLDLVGDAGTQAMVFVDALLSAQDGIAQSVNEAVRFSGADAVTLSVLFIDAAHPLAAALAEHGLSFDIPQPREPQLLRPPGSDPNTPPKLR